jgi:hypothetical protein
MANFMDITELSGEGRVPKRKFDEEAPPEEPWTNPYREKVRSQYPMKSRSETYKYFGIDPKYHTRNEDPSENVPPYTLPSEPELDFTILSADIICKYWSMKENRLVNFRDMRYRMEQLNVPSTWLATAIGGVAGYAMYASFTTIATTGAKWMMMRTLPSQFVAPVSAITTWASSSTHPVISAVTGATTWGSVGSQVKKQTTEKLDKMWVERRKKKARQDAIKKYEEISRLTLQDVDPDLFDLRSQCVNIYSLLCESRKLEKCTHSEPYNCRKLYMDSWGEEKDIITEYLDIPNQMIAAYTEHQDVNFFDEVAKPLFVRWHNIMMYSLPSAAGEIGLILSIWFPLIKTTNHRLVISNRVNLLLSWLYRNNISTYKMGIRSIFISMLVNKDNYFVAFLKRCVFPPKEDPHKYEKTHVLEEIWQELEEKLEGVTIDINIRMHQKYDFRGKKTEEASQPLSPEVLPSKFEITADLVDNADSLFHDMRTRMSGFEKNPIKNSINYLRSKELSEYGVFAWIVLFMRLVEEIQPHPHPNIYKVVVDPLMQLILDSMTEHQKGTLSADKVRYFARLFKTIKAMVKPLREDLDDQWTQQRDLETFYKLKSLAKFEKSTSGSTSKFLALPDVDTQQLLQEIQNDFENEAKNKSGIVEIQEGGWWRRM